MKAFVSKEFDQLKPSEKKRLIDIINREAEKKIDEEVEKWFCELQQIWLKMNIMSMHRNGLCLNTIKMVLGQWRMLYRTNHSKFKRNERQEWLDKEMEVIFGDIKWIDDYIESLKRI